MAPDPRLVQGKALALAQTVQAQLSALMAAGATPQSSVVLYEPAETTVSYSTGGVTGTWTCPAGVTAIAVTVTGSGAGGGGGNSGEGGEGGGGAGFNEDTSYAVTPGNTYSYYVAKGGTGGITGRAGLSGEASWFDLGGSAGGIAASGGAAGAAFVGGAGGPGSSAFTNRGTGFAGGTGGGTGSQGTGGCGGGGSGGSTGAGGNGVTSPGSASAAGGAAGSGGGAAGGAGGASGSSGSAGTAPGAGGGGCGAATGSGQVALSYAPTASAAYAGSDAVGSPASAMLNGTDAGSTSSNPLLVTVPQSGTLSQGGTTGNPGTVTGTRTSVMTFQASVGSDLAGVTIDQASLTLQNLTSYWPSGLEVILGYASLSALPVSFAGAGVTAVKTYLASAGSTATADLTAETGFLAALKSGAATALVLGPGSALAPASCGSFTGAGITTAANPGQPVLTVIGHTGSAQVKGGNGADGQISITYTTYVATSTIINTQGIFTYSAPPVLGTTLPGTLIASAANVSGTDAYGNAFLIGTCSYAAAAGGYLAVVMINGQVNWWSNATFGGTYSPVGGDGLAAGTGWANIIMDAAWVTTSGYNSPCYKLLPDGCLQLAGCADFGSTTTANHNLNSDHPLPAAFRPIDTKVYRADIQAGNRGAVQITAAGVIEMLCTTGNPGRYCELDGILTLDA